MHSWPKSQDRKSCCMCTTLSLSSLHIPLSFLLSPLRLPSLLSFVLHSDILHNLFSGKNVFFLLSWLQFSFSHKSEEGKPKLCEQKTKNFTYVTYMCILKQTVLRPLSRGTCSVVVLKHLVACIASDQTHVCTEPDFHNLSICTQVILTLLLISIQSSGTQV